MNTSNESTISALLAGEPDWTAIEIPLANGERSFVHGDKEGRRLRTAMYVREADSRLFCRVQFGPDAEGPPKHAHGGSMAAVLDDVMGFSAWVAGHPVVAAKITIEFRRKLPLGIGTTVEAWVERAEGRKIYARGLLYADDREKPFATGEGLFIEQSMEVFSNLMKTGSDVQQHLEKIAQTEE